MAAGPGYGTERMEIIADDGEKLKWSCTATPRTVKNNCYRTRLQDSGGRNYCCWRKTGISLHSDTRNGKKYCFRTMRVETIAAGIKTMKINCNGAALLH